MIKRIFLLLMLFQFNLVIGQKTLEQVVSEIQNDEVYSVGYSYYDGIEESKGISIQNEAKILERLQLEPLDYGEYYLSGKYEVNNSIILFVSQFWETEEVHFALLLDESLNLIDRLDETAYENAEGFYSVHTYVGENIVTTTSYNSYRNPNYLARKYTITQMGFKPIIDQVIVTVDSGCRVYEEPTANSITVSWANHLEVFDYLSEDFEADSALLSEGLLLGNSWFEVAKKDSLTHFGYVSGALAKRKISFTTNDYDVIVNELSEEDFHMEEVNEPSKSEIEKITDIDEIKKRLGTQLILEYNEEYDYHKIKGITADNGKEINLYWDEYGISAYYPSYHYLLLEGGHSSEHIIDLKSGEEDIDRIGNPEYYVFSPDNTFLLNGFYTGQAYVDFLVKNNDGGDPEYLFNFSNLLALDFIETLFWKDDHTIYARIGKEFYSIQLKKKRR